MIGNSNNAFFTLLVATLILYFCDIINAFTIVPSSSSSTTQRTKISAASLSFSSSRANQVVPTTTRLFAEAEDEEATSDEKESGEDDSSDDVEEEKEEELSEEEKEKLKIQNEIETLEEQLKQKRQLIRSKQELVDKYSKEGYARKVAEMENTKTLRRSLQQTNQYTSIAGAVQNFLPVLDELRELNDQYKDDEYGKQYSGVLGSLQTAFNQLDVEEYTVKEGDVLDKRRMNVVSEEYSDSIPKEQVIRPMKMGMEIKGNVMRMADCVVSLGSEEEAIKAKEEAEAAKAKAAEEEAKAEEGEKKEKKKKVRSDDDDE